MKREKGIEASTIAAVFVFAIISTMPAKKVSAGELGSRVATPPKAHRLSPTERRIVGWIDRHNGEAIDLLEKSVRIPSATGNLAGVREVGELFRGELQSIGFKTRWVALPEELGRAGHLFAERDGKRGKRLLIIGHLDTVVEGSPTLRERTILRGNGSSDMKGGDVVLIYALKALDAVGALEDHRIIVALTGDEEDPGRPIATTRAPLIEAGKRSDVALAFEGTVDQTGTIARRGVSKWTLRVEAKSGHSSGIFKPDLGSGAVFELSRILAEFYEHVRGEEYLTFNPSVVVGGTTVDFDDERHRGSAAGKTNVVAPTAIASGDLRFISNEQRERVKQKMREVVSRNLPQAKAEIVFVDEYPAMSPTEGNNALLREFDQVSRDLGYGEITLLDPGERGAGDISFVAPDISGLDGLGAMGDREHTPEELVQLEPFPMLIKRAALLIYRLTR